MDDWYNHAQYFGVFLLGFLVARGGRLQEAVVRLRWPALALWLGSWVALAWYFGHCPGAGLPPEPLRVAMRATWGLTQWWAIVAVLGFARRLAPGDGPVLRYLTAAVFPVYILHQTVIVVAAHHFRTLGLAAPVEGLLLVVVTFATCFGAYELIRRVAPLRPLFSLSMRAPHRREPVA